MEAAFAPTPLVGRRAELSHISALLDRSRVVSVVGPGGMGKTRVARELADRHSAPVWWVELADVAGPELVVHAIAGAFGVTGDPGDGPDLLASAMSDTRGLLVLDNCEHLVEAVASLAAGIVARCAGLSILATSRRPLSISTEAVYELPPLSVPALDRTNSVVTLAQFDAVALFVQRARATSSTFHLNDTNAEAVARLTTELDGLPLALELAAARTRVLSAEVILDRIGDRYRLLRHGFRDAPDRLQSLAASMDWSYDLCSGPEQALWARLSVFVGGFDIESAEDVCAGDGMAKEDVVDLVGSLVDKSIVSRAPGDASRYYLLESIRQYGSRRLGSSDLVRWRDRHRDWCAALTRDAEAAWISEDQVRLLQRLRAESANIRAALDYASASADQAPIALRMCRELDPFWVCTGQLGEGRIWIRRALAHGTGTSAERAHALIVDGFFSALQTDFTAAGAALLAARDLLESEESDEVRGRFLHATGFVQTWTGDLDGLDTLREARDLFEVSGNRRSKVQGNATLGMCSALAGDQAGAASAHRSGAAAAGSPTELIFLPWTLWALGVGGFAAGDLESATEYEREALRCARDLGIDLLRAAAVEALAWIAAADDRAERAATLRGATDRMWKLMTVPLADSPFVGEQRSRCDRRLHDLLTADDYDNAVARGSRLTLDEVVTFALDDAAATPEPRPATSPLTRRENEIADLVAAGHSNGQIADLLTISVRTVHGHMENILAKLGFRSRAQVAAWVVERRAD